MPNSILNYIRLYYNMISVCMATYNGEKYVEEQTRSILCQLGKDDELIISDDASNDNTITVIQQIKDDRIKILHNENHGIVHNFENALRNATGNYIFLCDQDDIWLPNKVNEMLEVLQSYDLVVSDCVVVDKNLKVISNSFFREEASCKGFVKNLYKNSYLGCCMAFRKKILEYVLPFPKHIAMHDIWIGLNVELRGSSFFLEKPLILYRRHGGNASSSSEKSHNPFLYKLQYRAYFVIHLFLRIFK